MPNEKNIRALEAMLLLLEGLGSRRIAEHLARQGGLVPKILTRLKARDLRTLRTNPYGRVPQNDDLQFILELERVARGGP
jgi:hypothetical protein